MEKESQKKNVMETSQDNASDSKLGQTMELSVEPIAVWSAKEERMIKLKLDAFLMPLLVTGFFVLQLDRSNMGNALTDTITEDLHITEDQVGTGNQLMSAGIVPAEIPSNLLLQRLGAPIWLTIIMCIWGTISLAQAFVTDLPSFYATRFLLGFFEGGYILGAQYVLALFYKSDELAMRTAVFYFGNYFSAATGSLIAAGILQLGGKHGLAGWQWLFIIEGAITLTAFLLFVALMPFSPARTRPVHGLFDVFSAREREVMQARVVTHDPSKAHAKAHISKADLIEAVSDFRIWLHGALNILAMTPKGIRKVHAPIHRGDCYLISYPPEQL